VIATISPPIVTWISDEESETARKRFRIQAIATSSVVLHPGAVRGDEDRDRNPPQRRLGIVRRVNDGGGTLLWDTRPDDHHHLVCRRCGRVEDIDAPVDLDQAHRSARRAGFAPDRAEVVVSGLCSSCASGATD